mmetsp:Transcript_11968/g.37438  ORF Transcript_11968/g.37438 Transcript_11968/m.37438 type:complete len:276 (+) Transcript_11968:2564-3391(+)
MAVDIHSRTQHHALQVHVLLPVNPHVAHPHGHGHGPAAEPALHVVVLQGQVPDAELHVPEASLLDEGSGPVLRVSKEPPGNVAPIRVERLPRVLAAPAVAAARREPVSAGHRCRWRATCLLLRRAEPRVDELHEPRLGHANVLVVPVLANVLYATSLSEAIPGADDHQQVAHADDRHLLARRLDDDVELLHEATAQGHGQMQRLERLWPQLGLVHPQHELAWLDLDHQVHLGYPEDVVKLAPESLHRLGLHDGVGIEHAGGYPQPNAQQADEPVH